MNRPASPHCPGSSRLLRITRHCAALGLAASVLALAQADAQPRSVAAGVSAAKGTGAPDETSQASDAGPGTSLGSGLAGRDSAWWVPLASTALPGWGQVRLGQNRFVGYLAVEAYSVIGYLSAVNTLHRERARFVDLARDVARAFVPGNTAVGDWDYYEAMEKHMSSGVFDRSPGTGQFSPEVDTATYNGAIWLRARRLSDWPNPNVEPGHGTVTYQEAISYYVAHAVHPEYAWSWRNAQLEWDLYRQAIRRKNDAGRAAGHYLAAVAVNHLLSTVDAFITLRLRGGAGAPRDGFNLSLAIPFK